ncbi:hypothetical protein KAR48_06265 [bacterium]|nr:hypothetical protein [bacterium]
MIINDKQKRIIYLLILALGGGLLNCTYDLSQKPQVPVWSILVTLPLVDDSWLLEEMVEDDSSFSFTPEGLMCYTYQESFDPVIFGDKLKLYPIEESISITLDSVSITPPEMPVKKIVLKDLNYPFPEHFNSYIDVEPFNITQTQQALDVPDNFKEINIKSAKLLLDVINGLPIPLGSETDTMKVILLDLKNKKQIGLFKFPGLLQPGDSTTYQIELHDILISNELAFGIQAESPGSEHSVLLDPNAFLEVRPVITDLVVHHAVAQIPDQDIEQTGQIDMENQSHIVAASIQSGQLVCKVTNTTPLGIHGKVSLSQLHVNGQPFVIDVSLGANEVDKLLTWDLADFQILELNGQLNYSIKGELTGSTGALVRIESTQGMSMDIALEELVLNYVKGNIEPTLIELDPIEISLNGDDLGMEFEGDVVFESIDLAINVANSSDIPFLLNAQLSVYDKDNSFVSSYRMPESLISPPQSTIHLTKENGFLDYFNQLFSQCGGLPSRIEMVGQAMLNPYSIEGEIDASDSLSGQITLNLPMSIAAMDLSLTDSTALDINADLREKTDLLSAVQLFAEVRNELPIAIHFYAIIIDSLTHTPLIRLPQTGMITVNAAPAPVNGGAESKPSTLSCIELALSKSEIANFMKGNKVITFLTVADNAQTSPLYRYCEVAVRCWAEIESTVDMDVISGNVKEGN